MRNLREKSRVVDGLVIALFALLFFGYLYNLTGWRIFDDEGEYLYQVWRMTLGEMPYRDFLTPQLPVFLYAGTMVMELAGNSLAAMRIYSVLLAFGSAALIYLAGRHRGRPLGGLLAATIFLLHPDVFRETRIFRNEPLFLLLVTAGLVIATWSLSERPKRWHLATAGAFFGLATMVKLFGMLPAGGVGLWLVWTAWKKRLPLRELILDGLALALPIVAVVGAIALAFTTIVPAFFDLVLGHHLNQGSSLAWREILAQKASLFWGYFVLYPVYLILAVVSAAAGFRAQDARRRWAWQIPTVLLFLLISREFGQRHFMYLLPALTLLTGWLLSDALRSRRPVVGSLFVLIALGAMAVPAVQANSYRASWLDDETQPLVDLIEVQTDARDTILADDIGLAYYARRPTTYSGAALSHGAVTSGQITGELLIDEIVEDDVRMVLADTSLLTGNHIVFLRDYPRFHRFLEANFDHLGNFRRDYQEIDVWWRPAEREFVVNDSLDVEYQDSIQFGDSIELLGFSMPQTELSPGDTLHFTLYWQAKTLPEGYWSVFAHLVGADGELLGQHDKVSYGGVYPTNRWWPGQVIDDDYEIEIPPEAASGRYRLVIGMYDWRTGERLAVFDDAMDPLADSQVTLSVPITVTSK